MSSFPPTSPTHPQFPTTRMRRNRQTDWRRRLVRENTLTVDDLILAIVVHDGPEARISVPSMPGTFRYSVQEAALVAKEAQDLGIALIAVFPFIDSSLKNDNGEEALNAGGLVPRAVAAMKAAVASTTSASTTGAKTGSRLRMKFAS
ncbi:MAG: hypothetical protein HC779_03000 [Phyllobacteriaceae bacterium]|nr:hypothetical protein [Phyllobacteriaceae bacterium]